MSDIDWKNTHAAIWRFTRLHTGVANCTRLHTGSDLANHMI